MNTFKDITLKMCKLYEEKNADYGNVFGQSCDKYGLLSPIIRLNDKLARLENLANSETLANVKDESIEDTLIDIANYAVMTILWMEQ